MNRWGRRQERGFGESHIALHGGLAILLTLPIISSVPAGLSLKRTTAHVGLALAASILCGRAAAQSWSVLWSIACAAIVWTAALAGGITARTLGAGSEVSAHAAVVGAFLGGWFALWLVYRRQAKLFGTK